MFWKYKSHDLDLNIKYNNKIDFGENTEKKNEQNFQGSVFNLEYVKKFWTFKVHEYSIKIF